MVLSPYLLSRLNAGQLEDCVTTPHALPIQTRSRTSSTRACKMSHKTRMILLANPNQRYFNNLVKTSYHKTPYRCPYRLSLSSQSSRSCAGSNIKVLKDKGLERSEERRVGRECRS